MTVYVEFLLTGLPCLDLRRLELFVVFIDSSLVTARSIGVVLMIEPLSAVERSLDELLDEQRRGVHIALEADVVPEAALVAAGNVVIGVAEVDNDIVAHFTGSVDSTKVATLFTTLAAPPATMTSLCCSSTSTGASLDMREISPCK